MQQRPLRIRINLTFGPSGIEVVVDIEPPPVVRRRTRQPGVDRNLSLIMKRRDFKRSLSATAARHVGGC